MKKCIFASLCKLLALCTVLLNNRFNKYTKNQIYRDFMAYNVPGEVRSNAFFRHEFLAVGGPRCDHTHSISYPPLMSGTRLHMN